MVIRHPGVGIASTVKSLSSFAGSDSHCRLVTPSSYDKHQPIEHVWPQLVSHLRWQTVNAVMFVHHYMFESCYTLPRQSIAVTVVASFTSFKCIMFMFGRSTCYLSECRACVMFAFVARCIDNANLLIVLLLVALRVWNGGTKILGGASR